MATEEEVRDKFSDAILAIGVSALGFDAGRVNVKDYLLEHERAEIRPQYLSALENGRAINHCWAVWCESYDAIRAMGLGYGNISINRSYTVTVRGYRDVGVNGAGVKALITEDLKVREAIIGLSSKLDNLVDRLDGMSSPVISLQTGNDGGTIVMLERTFTYEKANPGWGT